MTTDPEITTVRKQLGTQRQTNGRRSFTAAARDAAVRLAVVRKQRGVPYAQTAEALGLHDMVLVAWLRKARKSTAIRKAPKTAAPTFVALAVRDDAMAVAHSRDTSLVAVHALSGVRIEGLSLDQALALLRGLR